MVSNPLQDFPDDRNLANVSTDIEKVGLLVSEIHQLESTIRGLHQNSTQILGLGFVVAGVAVALTKDVSRDVALTVLPLFFGLTVIYHLNATAEAAALAELRDRLSIRVNAAVKSRILATRLVSDFRRGSRGTSGAFLMAGLILLASVGVGLVNAFTHDSAVWQAAQVAISLVVVGGCLVAALDIPKARIDVNRGLDTYFGASSRPASAPSQGGILKLVRDSIWGRPPP